MTSLFSAKEPFRPSTPFYSTLTEMQASRRNKLVFSSSLLVNVPVALFHQCIHSDYEEPTEMLFFVLLHGKMT